jgi:hypothetical protein
VAQPLGEYVFLRPRWPNSACLQQANQAMRSLGMPGDDLALDPGALVALARLTHGGIFASAWSAPSAALVFSGIVRTGTGNIPIWAEAAWRFCPTDYPATVPSRRFLEA